jgi:polysaccharide chain length determinant protein (PEP-CTERM system associated)
VDQTLQQLLTEIRGAWRFRWPAMAAAWAVGLVGIGISLTSPDRFEARAQVFVDTRDPLITSPSRGGDAQVSVAYVRRLMLATPNLEQVAKLTELDQRAETAQEFQQLISALKQQIQVVQVGRSGFEANLYTITYRDTDRDIAEKVVTVLLDSFQEQSLEGDLRDDIQALSFLDGQIDNYRRRLEEAEAGVADFRRRNAGLVGAEGDFFNRLRSLQDQLREVSTNLRIARETRAALAAQFKVPGSANAQGEAVTAGLLELENQVVQAERQLGELRLRYTDAHPSVITAQETLEALKSRLKQRRQDLGPLSSVGSSAAVLESFSIALTEAEIAVNEFSGRKRDLQQRIVELQEKAETAPQLEAEFAGLNRDNTVMREQYESLLERREVLNFDINRKRQGRQIEFNIIEPPMAPEFAVEPNRRMLLLLALVAALGTGTGLSFVLHQIRPVFVSSKMVYQELGIPVLGAASMTWTPHAMLEHRRTELLFGAGLALLLFVFGVIFIVLPMLSQFARQTMA